LKDCLRLQTKRDGGPPVLQRSAVVFSQPFADERRG
jgi:hypothetical protein